MALTVQEKVLWRLRGFIFANPAATIPPDIGLSQPIAIAGLFRSASGVGRACRNLADGMSARGADIIRLDLSPVFEQCDLPADPRAHSTPDALAAGAARAGAIIIHLNAPETDRALLALRCFRAVPTIARRPMIGVWVWETSKAPTEWRKASRRYTEIWAPSTFAADAIADVSDAPVRLMPHIVSAPDIDLTLTQESRAELGVDTNHFFCLTLADGRSSFHRKNPLGAIAAFQRGLPQTVDARLVVKTRGLSTAPDVAQQLTQAIDNDPRIIVIDKNMTEPAQWALLNAADAFISMHRAEGFGLPIAEALALGKGVVATGWSGNMDFMDDHPGAIPPKDLAPISDPTGRYPPDGDAHWAEPDIDASAMALSSLYAAWASGQPSTEDNRRYVRDLARLAPYGCKLVATSS